LRRVTLAGRGPAVLAFGVVALCTFVLFQPVCMGALRGAPRYFEWDVPEQYWPDLVYLCDALHDGELPTWNPYDRGGYPYYADPQAAPYHPLNWLVCAAAGRSPSLGWATARVVFGFLLCGLFSCLWLRRLRVSWGGTMIGAVLVEAAPFMRHNFELNLTTTLAWLPLMLWSCEGLVQHRRVRDGAWLALSFGLCGTTGSPPALWLAASFVGLYVAFRAARFVPAATGTQAVRVFVALAVAVMLSAGLLAVVLMPAAGLTAHSIQAGRSFASISADALTWSDLGALLAPEDGNHLYAGLAAFGLLPFAITGSRRGLVGFGLAIWLVAVLLSFGANGPLFRFAFDHVPGVHFFRLPTRYEAWIGPCSALIGALGFDGFCSRFRLKVPLSIALGSVIAMITIVDLSQRMPSTRHTRPYPPPGQLDQASAVIARAPNMGLDDRYMDEFGISCRSGTRLRRRDFRGYQDPLSLRTHARVLAALAEHPQLLEQFNVRYVLTGAHFIHGWNRQFLPPRSVVAALSGARNRGEGVIELTAALPLAYFVPQDEVRFASSAREALERVQAQAPSPVAVLEDAARPSSDMPLPPALIEGRNVRLARDSLSFDIDVPDHGVVVINETHYPGWQARVDDRPVPVLRANGLVRAVPVAPGRHHIAMRFEPPDAAWTRWLYALSLLACAVLLLARSRRRIFS